MTSVGAVLRGQTAIDFSSPWRKGVAISAAIVLLSLGLLGFRGLQFGIDFEGGIAWELIAPDVSTEEARDALEPFGLGDAKIQTVGDDTIRVQAGNESREDEAAVAEVLAELAGAEVNDVGINNVGPSWGDEITRSAVRALVFFFLAILAYLSLRLEWRMAVAALVAVVHDIIVSVGFYALTSIEVTPATVISFLTILGYSIYDTIVVFDKVRENEARPSVKGKLGPTALVSLSMNQVLLRSINTTVLSIIPVVAVLVVGSLILGVTVLTEFSVALAVGLTVGAYSSIFVAAPVLVFLKERDPKARAARERAAGGRSSASEKVARVRAAAGGEPMPAAESDAPAETDGGATPSGGRPGPSLSGNHPPRPRKKKKR
jgi:preprotein translocase subunit SecF